MIANILSAIPVGFDGQLITVEGDLSHGLPALNIVGMGSRTVSEAKDRVRSAIKSSGFSFPDEKITINLAPAELAKDGTSLDLAIALNILTLSGQLLPENTKDRLFVGELSLDGRIRPIRGIINLIEAAKQHGIREVYLPYQNFTQATMIPEVKLVGVKSLRELFLILKGQLSPSFPKNVVKNTKTEVNTPILDHIRGQSLAKRALAIAVAGHHNILFSGPPGAGKTLLAKTALSLLPSLSISEQISVTKIHALTSSEICDVITDRPFRAPHHTASSTSLIGGGPKASPGEISLSHLGVLFLDELPEFSRSLLESLRQPLEDKQITVSRANLKVTYPADFMLIATMNPCPCGYLGDPTHQCTCKDTDIARYQNKLSGPLLDRIDLFVDVERVKNSDLTTPVKATGEHNVVKNNITEAISRQHARFKDQTTFNSSLSSQQVSSILSLSPSAKLLLDSAADRLALSARAYFKVIKVAQTIADLAGTPVISDEHISEALSFRQKAHSL